MALRYVKRSSSTSQREFHRAREKTASLYSIPQLQVPSTTVPAQVDPATIRQAIVATHRALQLLQPQLENEVRRKLRRLAQRLLNIDHELDHLAQNECTLASQSAVRRSKSVLDYSAHLHQ